MTHNFRDVPQAASPGAQLTQPPEAYLSSSLQQQDSQQQYARDLRTHSETRRGRIKMLLLLLFCASPVIASYLVYYVFQPLGGVTNYGTLITPVQPIPSNLTVVDEVQSTHYLSALFDKKWLLVSIDDAATCSPACVKKLFLMRQLRIAQGPQRARIVPVWLITDDAKIDPMILQAYSGAYAATRFLRASAATLHRWLPLEKNKSTKDYLYLIDPRGNLMMRFPADPDVKKMRQDIGKLLKWNVIGQAATEAGQ